MSGLAPESRATGRKNSGMAGSLQELSLKSWPAGMWLQCGRTTHTFGPARFLSELSYPWSGRVPIGACPGRGRRMAGKDNEDKEEKEVRGPLRSKARHSNGVRGQITNWNRVGSLGIPVRGFPMRGEEGKGETAREKKDPQACW